MRTRPLLALAAVAALVAGSALTGPASVAKKQVPGHTTATGSVFMVNPVQSSGDQTLTDQKDSADAVLASEYATVQLRNLDGSGYLSGDWVNVQSSTGKPAYSSSGDLRLRPQPGPVRAGDGLLLDQPGPGVPAVPRFRRLRPAGHRRRAARREDQPVRRRQQLPDRQALPAPARQGWRRRRRGRRGDRPRVRPRDPRRPGAGLRAEPRRRRDRGGVRRLPRRDRRTRRCRAVRLAGAGRDAGRDEPGLGRGGLRGGLGRHRVQPEPDRKVPAPDRPGLHPRRPPAPGPLRRHDLERCALGHPRRLREAGAGHRERGTGL